MQNFNSIDGNANTTRLALVASTTSMSRLEQAAQSSSTGRSVGTTGASFGSRIDNQSPQAASVRAIAARYENLDDALLPMVLASGVTGDAAVAVATAVRNNPALLAQADRAFQRAKLSAVE